MTVQKLIDKLQKIEDKNAKIEVAVRTSNKAHPVAYCEVHENDYENLSYGRIEIYLPSDNEKFMYVGERKF